MTRNTSDQQLQNRGLVGSINEVVLGLDNLRDKIKGVRAAGFEEVSSDVAENTVNPLAATVERLLAQIDALKSGKTKGKTPEDEKGRGN